MSNLYQDAILDAKALRASAMANAKAALEEAFEPKIQEMISKHLSEEEEMEEAKDHEMEEGYEEEGKMPVEEADINEAELEEILNQLEEMSAPKEESLNEAEEEEKEEEEEEGETAEGEEVSDETKIIDITLGDLKQVIQSLMPGDQAMPAAEEPTADSEAEEEVSLDEILDELESEGMETSGHYDAPDVNPATVKAGSQVEEEGLNEGGSDEGTLKKLAAKISPEIQAKITAVVNSKKGLQEDVTSPEFWSTFAEFLKHPEWWGSINFTKMVAEIGGLGILAGAISAAAAYLGSKVKSFVKGKSAPKEQTPTNELEEAKATIETLRKDLQEVNLLNAKYLYMNKLFKSKSLTEAQKVKVINALDRATNVTEVKLTYETLKESFEKKKETIKESIGFASKPAGVAPKANIMEADTFINRWQKLAGIK
jgi:hypothetical protein